jgi:hypothetical protein
MISLSETPQQTSPNAKATRSDLATTAILLSCTHEVSTYLSGITDPKAMWDTLAEHLSSASSFGRRVTIGKNFDNDRPKTTPEQYQPMLDVMQ